jgi:hypothetical protein
MSVWERASDRDRMKGYSKVTLGRRPVTGLSDCGNQRLGAKKPVPRRRLHATWYIITRRTGVEPRVMEGTLRWCRSISLIIIGVCVFVTGCGGSETIWSAECPSPDASILASARTIANSGFATGYTATYVFLGGANHKQEPTEILELTDEFDTPSDEISIEMRWLTPTHLELTYKGHRTLDFQAISWADVDISVRDFSTKTEKSRK